MVGACCFKGVGFWVDLRLSCGGSDCELACGIWFCGGVVCAWDNHGLACWGCLDFSFVGMVRYII